jgi:7-cyano-7-deazaguanine synthase
MPSNRDISATVLMSGGIDSTACVHFLQKQGERPRGIFVDHGQAAAQREARAIAVLAPRLGIEVDTFRLSGTTGLGAGELVGRNAMLIFSALFLTRGRPGLLATGLHAGTPYFDCSNAFLSQTARLVSEHTDGRVSLIAPFIEWSKKDIFDYFKRERLPIDLTYSCEAGTDPVCGRCASCRDRQALA